jgi:diaminopimelate epimerase
MQMSSFVRTVDHGWPFHKINATGNIIGVIVDDGQLPALTPGVVRAFCSRDWGIECEELMVAGPTMDIWNCNGTLAQACGNGTRAVISVLRDASDTRPITVSGPVGPLTGYRRDDGQISVIQGTVHVGMVPGMDTLPETIHFDDIQVAGIPVSVGNLHVVVLSPPPRTLALSWHPVHPLFPTGVNVSFVSMVNGSFLVQTWERGFGRTLSCGSGACATAAVLHAKGLCDQTVTLNTPGGPIFLQNDQGQWTHTASVSCIAKGHWFNHTT